MRFFYCLFFFAACTGSPKPSLPPPEPASPLAEKTTRLINKALSLSSEGGFNSAAFVKSLQEHGSNWLQEIYIKRLYAFVDELKADTESLQNIIQVKNLYLNQPAAQATQKLAQNPKALDLLMDIKTGLYGPDGQLFKQMLLEAAHNPEKREILFMGEAMLECLKEPAAWWNPNILPNKLQCGLKHPIYAYHLSGSYGKLLQAFGETKLNRALQALNPEPTPRDELIWSAMKLIKVVDYPSLGWLHTYVKNLSEAELKDWLIFFADSLDSSNKKELQNTFKQLEPELKEVGHALIESYTGKSLQELTWEELYQFLDKLSAFLRNEEYGPLWFIKHRD